MTRKTETIVKAATARTHKAALAVVQTAPVRRARPRKLVAKPFSELDTKLSALQQARRAKAVLAATQRLGRFFDHALRDLHAIGGTDPKHAQLGSPHLTLALRHIEDAESRLGRYLAEALAK